MTEGCRVSKYVGTKSRVNTPYCANGLRPFALFLGYAGGLGLPAIRISFVTCGQINKNMIDDRFAIIDLGTNTFQLLVADSTGHILHDESRAAKIGKAGISQGLISEEAIERAIEVLQYFRSISDSLGVAVSNVRGIGTSAIRNAHNQAEFMERIRSATGIEIEVISGNDEAQLIYEGVRFGGCIGSELALVMDIGGGSVEFILCNHQRIFWKQSFEIGGQRLMDRFMSSDPLSPGAVKKLYEYLEEQLLPLTNAVHQYAPQVLVGSAGSFETLLEMHHARTGFEAAPQQVSFELPQASFYESYQYLMSLERAQRLALPGMIELRVDMIVVGVALIDFVLRKYSISRITVTYYALKEGMLARQIAPSSSILNQ